MPYRKQQFDNNSIYHIILRAIDNNVLFNNTNDYYRGIFSLYEFNDSRAANIQRRRKARARFKKGRGRASTFIDERDRLVDILCFCFMPNHIHLLLKQIKDNGITKFMSKTGTGLGGYINRKYNRQGHVFQSRFNAVHIKTDEQLKVVLAYICTNPLSLKYPEWKKIRIENPAGAHAFLEEYKWSSYPDFIGIKNFPSVTQRDFIVETMGGFDGCRDFVKNWIEYKGELEKYHNLFLED
ncbi:hypothetical protein AMJ47_00280 [Parcubacteria bacterium DG_72]|nr:MAG: hypothetical protein AMJ47_00280 [Parcubacteria bacterium DG_72]